MKKKLIVIGLIVVLSFSLCGCSFVDSMKTKLSSWMEKRLIEKSGISEDEDYKTAEANKNAGVLDENGNYLISEETFEAGQPMGSIHLTFAKNSCVDVSYFYDEALTKPIDESSCYLNPGDTIYVSDTIVKSANSDQYSFSGFRFIVYDVDGQRVGETDLITEKGGAIFIPKDFAETEIAVEPFGLYEQRPVTLKAYWENAKGEEIAIADGTWTINDEIYEEETIVINPSISYIVKYEYDPQQYYFVETQGELFNPNGIDGTVQFKQVIATNGIGTFRIELHPYSSIIISNGKGISSINASGRDSVDISSNDIAIEQLKPGDKVTIITDSDYKLTCDKKKISPTIISDEGNRFEINISKDDEGPIEIKAIKWETKTLDIEVEENAFWDKIKNNYLSWLPFVETMEDNKVLVISSCGKEYSLSDIQNGKSIKISEKEPVTISIDKSKLDGFSIELKINDNKPIQISKDSNTFSFEYKYNEISTISIGLIED